MGYKADRDLLDITEMLKSGVSTNELKEMIKKCGDNYAFFEKSLRLTEDSDGSHLKFLLSEGNEFNRYELETIIDSYYLYKYGVSVFESESLFNEWIYDHIPAMEHRRPIDLIDSFAGRDWVATILIRLDYGVFS